MIQQFFSLVLVSAFSSLWILGLRIWPLHASWVGAAEKWVREQIKGAKTWQKVLTFVLKPTFLCGYCMSSMHTLIWYVAFAKQGLIPAPNMLWHGLYYAACVFITLVLVSRLFAMQRRGLF